MRIRTVWSPTLIILPMVALGLSLVLWGRDYNDYVAAQGHTGAPVVGPKGNDINPASAAPLSGFHRGNAVTCFTHPKVTLCYWMTKERG